VIVAIPPPAPPIEIYYPVPVYTGVVVINPPERENKSKDRTSGAPGPPPISNPSSRTIAEKPRAPKPIEAKPPSTPRGDDPPRDHHAPSIPVARTEPVRVSPPSPPSPPREDPKPANPRAPVAPAAQPAHDPKPVLTPPAPAPAPADKDKK
jgi:hypothetical protein